MFYVMGREPKTVEVISRVPDHYNDSTRDSEFPIHRMIRRHTGPAIANSKAPDEHESAEEADGRDDTNQQMEKKSLHGRQVS